LQLNALIDNGNWIGARWYMAAPEEPETPELYVQGLACRGGGAHRSCAFTLVREAGAATTAAPDVPRRIACTVRFVRERDGWQVGHGPSPGGGHSLTSMRCRPAPAA
jgi:hypothetical protein